MTKAKMKEAYAFPASVAQERFWLLDRLESDDGTYHIAAAVRFKGPLNVDALGRSLEMIVERHESLRTRFKLVDEKVLQIISKESDIVLELVETEADYNRAPQEFLEKLSAIAQKPFKLECGSLLRAVVFKTFEKDHTLL